MLKIVYFIGNLDKYLLQMVDTNTGLLCKAFKGFPCSNIFELGLIHNLKKNIVIKHGRTQR